MTEPDSAGGAKTDEARLKKAAADTITNDPDWTRGLKRLYDQVLEEPMPESFKDLLNKLDDNSSR